MTETDVQPPIGEAEQGRAPRPEPPRGKGSGSARGTLIGIAGGLVIVGIASGVVWARVHGDKSTGLGEESTLEVLQPAEINAALPTLDPVTAKAAVDDAKNCKAPLAWVTLTQRPSGNGGLIRIRSGPYLSPPIKLTPVPQRVAIPYPAPYPAGRGVLTLVGEADQVGFYLTPGSIQDVNGVYAVNVRWQVRNPCL
uniref:hypothetical protein n=1 Tax=Bradyrhizobium sp. (strain ORS 278) TaxID=114615 RepID=UPI00067FD97B|nr:hypothetical protein [Bradyrhizobium sp. ORS 278]